MFFRSLHHQMTQLLCWITLYILYLYASVIHISMRTEITDMAHTISKFKYTF